MGVGKLWLLGPVLVHELRMVFIFLNGSKNEKKNNTYDKKIIGGLHFGGYK